MRIVMVTMGLDIGGAETHIVELVKELKKQGHDVAVVSNGGVYVKEITQAGIRHYQAPLHRRSVKDMLLSYLILDEVIRWEKPDIVHAHARIPAFLCGRLNKRIRFSFVTTAHWVFDSKGVLRYLTNWGQRTIAVSNDIKEYLIREYQVPEEHISLTINGIDTDKFSPEVSRDRILKEFSLNGEKPIISYVSRMDEDRALVARQLIEIAPRLDKDFPGVQMLIAGGGNVYRELKEKSEQVNRQLGRTCIVMPGPRTDINEIAAAGDVFVGVSRSALEAMSAAKPVIVAGNEGYHGLFTQDKLEEAMLGNFCCRGLPMSEPERLYQDLKEVLGYDAQKKAELGACGRQVILDHYSVRRMAQDCLAMYQTVKKPRYHVVISGYYGYTNTGDDAILQSIHQSLRAASDEVEILVLSNDPEETKQSYGIDAVARFKVWDVLRALRWGDVLLSGGGSLLQDRTSTRSILYYLLVMLMAECLDTSVVLYANGIGPVDRPANRRRVKRRVDRAALVTLRDRDSELELRKMGVKNPNVYVTADPVFTLEPADRKESRDLLWEVGLKDDANIVAVSVRDWPDTEQFVVEVAALCDHLRRTYGLEVLFLLMQPYKDWITTEKVRQAMEEPSYLMDIICSPRELMGVLGEAKLCLAMRLHTLIFAARMAVPVLGLVYDPKVESYLKELDLPSAGHVDTFDRAYAIEQADRLMERYDQCRAQLKERAQQLARESRKNEQLLMQLLDRRG